MLHTSGAYRRGVQPYPASEPYHDGFLDVGDGHRVYYAVAGNPDGKPAVVLHGGPGQGSRPGHRRWFDPERYRIVAFDQRSCGRSTPPASDLRTSMHANTTHHLIADMERLREQLGIDRWLVAGGSWGVTLALAYAQRHPERVTELALVAVTMTRPQDVHWLYHEAGRFFPEQWQRFRDFLPAGERGGDLVAAYDHVLNGDDVAEELREQAAASWCAWEDAVVSLEEGWAPNPRWADRDHRVEFARLCAHYFSHAAWLGPTELLDNAQRLQGIPGVLAHGNFDISGPPDVPWLLAQAWPDAELHLVRVGHSGRGLIDPICAATDRWA
jgi:proline iminopeptidase